MPRWVVETEVDEDQIARAVLEGFIEILEAAVDGSLVPIASRAQQTIRTAVQLTPEYGSLLSGDLWHELGVVNPAGAMNAILATMMDSVLVTKLPFAHNGRDLTAGGLRLQAVQVDFADLLGLKEATFQSVSRRGVFDIDWLQWLLTGTGSVSVPYPNTNFHFVGETRGSRTGYGLMKRSGTWAIPSEFAGTIADNWLTRALATAEPVIEDIIHEEIGSRT